MPYKLTHLQRFRFRTLFNEHSERFRRSVKTEDGRLLQLEFPDRIDSQRLIMLMKQIGLELTPEIAQETILRYDSSCQGMLDFEDFLQVGRDIEPILEQNWKDQSELQEDDPYEWLFMQTKAFGIVGPDGMIVEEGYLKRNINICVFHAYHLDRYARVKPRKDTGIAYEAMDPVVEVIFNGESKRTSVLNGTTSPEWCQNLTFDVQIPYGHMADVQEWVERQCFEITLFDYIDDGFCPHLEWIGSAHIPLITILTSAQSSFDATLLLKTNTATEPFITGCKLEVSITDSSRELYPWPAVLDFYAKPTDIWHMFNYEKLRNDMETTKTTPPKQKLSDLLKSKKASNLTAAEETKLMDMDKEEEKVKSVSKYYEDTMFHIRDKARYRHHYTLCLSEANQFIFLSALVKPLKPAFSFGSTLEVARFVASLEGLSTITKCMDGTGTRPNQHFEDDHRYLTPCSRFCPETLLNPVASPTTVLYRGYGSNIERAALLCSLFTGMGVQAFVALGSYHAQNCVWVVTLLPEQVTMMKGNQLATVVNTATKGIRDFWGGNITLQQFHTLVNKQEQELYALYPKLASIETKLKGLVPIHWDVTTGVPWLSPLQPGFPYSHLGTLFNHENIWFNIQATEYLIRPAFSWNTKDSDEWYPFFNQRFLTRHGPPSPVYIDPAMLCSPQFYLIDPDFEDRILLDTMLELIQAYRTNILLLPATAFHRLASQLMQKALSEFIDKRKDLKRDGVEIMKRDLNAAMVYHYPDGYAWHGRVFRFLNIPPEEIFERLAWSGVINYSTPKTMYAVAVKTKYIGPLRCVWVYIGYLFDLTVKFLE